MPSLPSAADTTRPLGRRQRKKAATRDRIYDCAIRLFATRGYDATSMEDISECADVARATVFNYFARKEDLLNEWASRRRAGSVEILAAAQREGVGTPGRLRVALTRLDHYNEENPAESRAMIRAWLRAGGPLLPTASDTAHLFADTIRYGQHQGDTRSDIDPDTAGRLLLDAYLGILYRWVTQTDQTAEALQHSLMAMLDLVLAGISDAKAPPKRPRPKGHTANR